MPEKKSAGGTENGWHLKEIQKLIDLLIERDVAEFEMEKEGVRIRVRRAESRAPAPAAAPAIFSPTVLPLTIPATAPMSAPQVVSATMEAAAPASSLQESAPVPAAEAPASDSSESLYIIKSPLVGTYYGSPSPNAEAFVKPGDAVRVGQVLCIIEAMKLMNEIESEVGGEIVRIYVENGQPVEYGQSLYAIKPSLKR